MTDLEVPSSGPRGVTWDVSGAWWEITSRAGGPGRATALPLAAQYCPVLLCS